MPDNIELKQKLIRATIDYSDVHFIVTNISKLPEQEQIDLLAENNYQFLKDILLSHPFTNYASTQEYKDLAKIASILPSNERIAAEKATGYTLINTIASHSPQSFAETMSALPKDEQIYALKHNDYYFINEVMSQKLQLSAHKDEAVEFFKDMMGMLTEEEKIAVARNGEFENKVISRAALTSPEIFQGIISVFPPEEQERLYQQHRVDLERRLTEEEKLLAPIIAGESTSHVDHLNAMVKAKDIVNSKKALSSLSRVASTDKITSDMKITHDVLDIIIEYVAGRQAPILMRELQKKQDIATITKMVSDSLNFVYQGIRSLSPYYRRQIEAKKHTEQTTQALQENRYEMKERQRQSSNKGRLSPSR